MSSIDTATRSINVRLTSPLTLGTRRSTKFALAGALLWEEGLL